MLLGLCCLSLKQSLITGMLKCENYPTYPQFTVKALLNSQGACSILDTPTGGLSERGAYSQNQVTRIYIIYD